MSRVSAAERRAGLFMQHMLLNSSDVRSVPYRKNIMPLRRRDARPNMSLELDITRLGEGRNEPFADYIRRRGAVSFFRCAAATAWLAPRSTTVSNDRNVPDE